MTLTDFIKRATPASLYAPTATLGALKERNANPMFAAASTKEYGLDYYLRGALAGGICGSRAACLPTIESRIVA